MAKKSLKRGDQVYNGLCFIKALLVNAGGYSEVKKLVKEYHIIDILLTAAEAYLGKISKFFKNSYDYNKIEYVENKLAEKDQDLFSVYSHRDHIEKMFDIFQYILEKSYNSTTFSEKELEKMFIIFVSKRISNFESETLFEFL